jgi:pimeloyl-ACP methyl ester carboxylesterase
MLTVYFIPGLGADHRLYQNIAIDGVNVRYLEWMEPESCTSLEAYALKFLPLIDVSTPFVLCGTSMGGMVSIELSKKIKPVKLILISTVKTKHEFPHHLRILAKTRLLDILNNSLKPTLTSMLNLVINWPTASQQSLFLEMLNNCSNTYLKFAIEACVNWNNEEMPTNYLHLHGTADPLFPITKIDHATTIKGGNHFMVYEKGEELSELISNFLKEEIENNK